MKAEGSQSGATVKKDAKPKAARKPMGRPPKEEALKPAALRKLTAEAYYRWIKNMESDFDKMEYRDRVAYGRVLMTYLPEDNNATSDSEAALSSEAMSKEIAELKKKAKIKKEA